MSTGGQPSQLAAMIQMGMEGGRSTSILLMKFIIYQVVVLFAYVSTIIFGFHMVMTKFAGLAIFIGIGFFNSRMFNCIFISNYVCLSFY